MSASWPDGLYRVTFHGEGPACCGFVLRRGRVVRSAPYLRRLLRHGPRLLTLLRDAGTATVEWLGP